MGIAKVRARSVLVVDDDEMLTDSIANLLKLDGYEVWTAYDGVQGYASYFRHPTEFVVTDIQMPQWDGFEMMRSIRALSPSVKAIYISGAVEKYRAKINNREDNAAGLILEKPFTRNDLRAMLEKDFAASVQRNESVHSQ